MLRATYRSTGTGWEGVVKDGKTIVAACGHHHRNRDQTTSRGTAAIFCAQKLLRSLKQSDMNDTHVARQVASPSV